METRSEENVKWVESTFSPESTNKIHRLLEGNYSKQSINYVAGMIKDGNGPRNLTHHLIANLYDIINKFEAERQALAAEETEEMKNYLNKISFKS